MLTAFCYAEYAAELPVAGGAFNYISMTYGEFAAWVTACDLILEYTLSAAAVAKGFTSYTAALLGVDVKYLRLQASLFTVDLPAAAAVVAMSFILMRSTAESSVFNVIVSGLNVVLILFVLGAGFPNADADNYQPFMPFGLRGVFTGASVVFFSFIGFDTVATAAEEVKNPGRDLPIGIVGSLSICTLLYVAMCLAITGMESYTTIDLNAPFAVAFSKVGMEWAQRLVAAGALTGIITSLLGSLLGQARIYVTLGRQALAPAWLARVHPVRRTPTNATLVTMFTAGFLALFIDIELLAELVSIGTLVVFCSVCSGVLFRRYHVHGSGEPLRPLGLRLGGVVLASVGFSVSFTERAPVAVPIVFLVLWLAVTASFLMLPVRYTPQVFRCPCSPFLPSLGMLSTLHLIGSLGWPAYVRWIVWFVLGTAVYLCYGLHRSQPLSDAAAPRCSDPGVALSQSFIGPSDSPGESAQPSGGGAGAGAATGDDVQQQQHHRNHADGGNSFNGGGGSGGGSSFGAAGLHHAAAAAEGAPGGGGGGDDDCPVYGSRPGSAVGGRSGGGSALFAYGRPYGMPVPEDAELEMLSMGGGGGRGGGSPAAGSAAASASGWRAGSFMSAVSHLSASGGSGMGAGAGSATTTAGQGGQGQGQHVGDRVGLLGSETNMRSDGSAIRSWGPSATSRGVGSSGNSRSSQK
ncbi:hypothetical protein PLESTM_000660300 [Pleodorina starrii]|nr:hypothetical protein PLESTM_000660300 [Pleodorina starrii]